MLSYGDVNFHPERQEPALDKRSRKTQEAIVRAYEELTREKGSIREALSLPFQQTARYVTEYGDEISDADRAAIDAVLNYDEIPELYTPRIADPVKNTFRSTASTQDLIRYLSVWFRQFFRHPSVYFNATLNQNYYLIYPSVLNEGIYYGLSTGSTVEQSVWEVLDVFIPERLIPARAKLLAYYRLLARTPVLNLLCHTAAYVILLLFLLAFAVLRKDRRFCLAATPSVLSCVIVILAPAICAHPRYALPVVYVTPLLLSYYLCRGNRA